MCAAVLVQFPHGYGRCLPWRREGGVISHSSSRAVIQHGRAGREGVLEDSRSPHSSQEGEREEMERRGKREGRVEFLHF